MGGSLRAHSEPGEGSTFMLACRVGGHRSDLGRALDETQPDPPRYRRRQVHYVEDNETNAEVMRGILQQRPQVELASPAAPLMRSPAMASASPDLILLDMNLPDMDGLELLRRLKTAAATAPIPVVAVSADATAARIGESHRRRRRTLPDEAGQRR